MDTWVLEQALRELSIVFSHNGWTPAEFQAMSRVWMEDLGQLSEPDFKMAVRMHRANSNRFPTPHDILRQHTVIVNNRRRTIKMPEITRTEDEQLEINRQGIARVRQALHKANIEPIEGFSRMTINESVGCIPPAKRAEG